MAKTPIFAHGSLEGVKKLISGGTLHYPSYIWITEGSENGKDYSNTYNFLNQQGELETVGIPEHYGEIGEPLILSELTDGIHKVAGSYKITITDETLYSAGSFIFVIKAEDKIRRITADEIVTYTVTDGVLTDTTQVVTDKYLIDNKYIDEQALDDKLVNVEDELKEYVDDRVVELIDENIQVVPQNDIRGLFDE